MPLPPHEQDLGAPDSGRLAVLERRQGDDFETTMTHAVTSAGHRAHRSRSRYQIETDWDYAYLEATSDGTTWTPLDTNLSTDTDPNEQNQGTASPAPPTVPGST